MNFPEWHYVKNGDFPENYREYITYSYKCNEYTYPVLVVTKSCKTIKALRVRLTTEENFKWTSCKAITKPLHFNPENVVMWTFLPTRNYLKNVINGK